MISSAKACRPKCRRESDEGDKIVKTQYKHSCRHCRPRHTRSHHYIDTANPSFIEKAADAVWMFLMYIMPAALAYAALLILVAPE